MQVQVYGSVFLSLCKCECLFEGEEQGGAALDYYFIIASYCSRLHSPRGFLPTHAHACRTALICSLHRGDDNSESSVLLLLSFQLVPLMLLFIQDLKAMTKPAHPSIKNAGEFQMTACMLALREKI